MPSASDGDTFLYLETKGRSSGLPRRIEIWFVEVDGRYYLVAEMAERAQWVKNVQVEPHVHFAVGTRANHEAHVRWTAARARIVDTSSEAALVARARAAMDAKYAWSDGLLVEIAHNRP
jgi:deazaflavin-dependent oxidoreductase (nitroreductase family)